MRMGMRLPEKDIKKTASTFLKNKLLFFRFLLVLGTKMTDFFFSFNSNILIPSDSYLLKWFISVLVPKIEIYKEKYRVYLKSLALVLEARQPVNTSHKQLKWNKLSMYWSLLFYVCYSLGNTQWNFFRLTSSRRCSLYLHISFLLFVKWYQKRPLYFRLVS